VPKELFALILDSIFISTVELGFEHMQYVIEGSGLLVADKREHKIKKADFALILPDEKHQIKNTSKTRNLLILCAVPKEYE